MPGMYAYQMYTCQTGSKCWKVIFSGHLHVSLPFANFEMKVIFDVALELQKPLLCT